MLVLIDPEAGEAIGSMQFGGGLAAAFDGDTTQVSTSSALSASDTGYVGKTLAEAAIFGRALVYGSTNIGFGDTVGESVTLTIRGKEGDAPASRTDGTALGAVTLTDVANQSAPQVINSTDRVNTWDHLWVDVNSASTGTVCAVAELTLYELV